MDYLPSFDRTGGVWKPVQAVVPTAAISAIASGVLFGLYVAVFESIAAIAPEAATFGEFVRALWAEPFLIIYAIARLIYTVTLAVLLVLLPAFFLVAMVLIVFGLPAAWLLGRYVRSWASIPLALMASYGTGYVLLGIPLIAGSTITWTENPLVMAILLTLVLLTGLLYRHFLIAFRDEDELLD